MALAIRFLLCRKESHQLLGLDQILHQCVIGQDEALPAGRHACKPSPTPSSAPALFSL
jgi:ATP-dependent Clp protease ATP-binding subunit ClpA